MNPHDDIQTELLRNIWNEMKALGRNLGARIEKLDESLGARIDANTARIDKLDASLGARIDATNERVDGTNKRLDAFKAETRKAFFELQARLSTELIAVNGGIETVNGGIEKMSAAFATWRSDPKILAAHDDAITDLRARVERLEERG